VGLRIVLFGLGHVGATMAGCLAAAGHSVHGVDPDPAVVAAVAAGRAPVREPGLEARLREGVAAGRLTAAAATGDALRDADLAAVCVPTPAGPDGRLEFEAVRAVVEEIAAALPRRSADALPLVVLLRSTVPPGTAAELVLPLLAAGGRCELAVNPEFLRQGSAVADFERPARIVLGERAPGATRRAAGLYDDPPAPVLEVSFKVAELAKLADNGWHALKVAFANEVGRLAVAAGTDPEAVMAVLRADPRHSLGPAYLRPGGPYGGPCLEKDLAALSAGASDLPLLEGVAASNALHAAWLLERVQALVPPPGPVLQVGLSFKPGSDDLRASPLARLARGLAALGYRLSLHDPDLAPGALRAACAPLGALPCPSRAAALEAAATAGLVFLGKPTAELRPLLPAAVPVLELAGLRLP
jgi:GDP-mannose 6-dehydrogenase